MRKEVFLEYKFGNYNFESLRNSGANGTIAWMGNLTSERWQELKELNIHLGICTIGTKPGVCPLDPEERERLNNKIEQALSYNPNTLWIDHMRFDGHWEGIHSGKIPDLHRPCQWCRGSDRVATVIDIAQRIKSQVKDQCQLAYFAIPFKPEEVPLLTSQVGQDHVVLAEYFDFISPMLYHRIIGKHLSYISEYVSWLSDVTHKPVLPIIQVKDMPDYLQDELTTNEMEHAYQEAVKPPSIGVAWFSWDGAVEKNKTKIISKIFVEKY